MSDEMKNNIEKLISKNNRLIKEAVIDEITDKLKDLHLRPSWEKGSYDDAIDEAIDMILEMRDR